jgi:hypothetical protein
MSSTLRTSTSQRVDDGQAGTVQNVASVVAGAIFLTIASQPSYAITFSAPQQIIGTAMQDAEPPQIAASGQRAYIIWHEYPTASDVQPDVFFSRSTNSGTSFRPRSNISNTAGVSSDNERIATSGNNVFVVWSENADEILLRRSANAGSSFAPAQKLSTTPGATLPQVIASGSNVLVAWQVAIGQGGANPDIFFTFSSDGGSSFAPEKNLSNNNGTSEFRDHGLRQLAGPGNKFVVTWRDDTTGDFEIFFAQGN